MSLHDMYCHHLTTKAHPAVLRIAAFAKYCPQNAVHIMLLRHHSFKTW